MGYNQSFKQKQHLIRRYGCLLLVFIFGLSVIGCQTDPDSNLKSNEEAAKQMLLRRLPPVENEFVEAFVLYSTVQQKDILVTITATRKNYQFKKSGFEKIKANTEILNTDNSHGYGIKKEDGSTDFSEMFKMLDEAQIAYKKQGDGLIILEDCRLLNQLECSFDYERNAYVYDQVTWEKPTNIKVISQKSSETRFNFGTDTNHETGRQWYINEAPWFRSEMAQDAIATYDSYTTNEIQKRFKKAAFNEQVDTMVERLLPEYGLGEKPDN